MKYKKALESILRLSNSLDTHIYTYINTHTHTHTYIYIYIEREREGEKESIFNCYIKICLLHT